MQQVVSQGLWQQIKAAASKAKHRVAAIAYVSTDKYLRFGKGDILVVDASDNAIKCRRTSRDVIADAVKKRASVYHCPGLHAKLIVLDRLAIVGSANLSASSAESLIEVALFCDQPTTVSAMHAIIEHLAAQSIPIDEAFIHHIRTLKLEPHWSPTSRRRKDAQVDPGLPKTWIVGVQDLGDDAYPDEKADAEAGQKQALKTKTLKGSDISWIRFTGNSRFQREAKKGDIVIQLYRPSVTKRVRAVYRHAPILRRQDEAKCIRFYVEDYADAKDTALTWKRFRELLKHSGYSGKIGPDSIRMLDAGIAESLYIRWQGK